MFYQQPPKEPESKADVLPLPTESAEEGEEAEPVVNWKEVLEEITRLDAEAEAFAAAHSNAK